MITSLYKCNCGKITEHQHSIKERPEKIKCSCGLDAEFSFKETTKANHNDALWFNDARNGAISRTFL